MEELFFISSPSLTMKGEGKDCRGEGSAEQKVPTRGGVSVL